MSSSIRTLAVIALLALLVGLAGCADGGSTDGGLENAPSAAALQENVTASMQDVETVSFSMEQTIEGASSGDVTGEVVMNLTAERARMNMTAQSGMGEQQIEQYIVGDTAYVHANDQWVQMDLSGMNTWNRSNQFDAQQELIQNSSVEVTGRETHDGQDVWVVSIEPDPQEFRSLLAQQSGMGSMPENVEIRDIAATQYVDTESYRVRGVDMRIGLQSQGQNVTALANMTFHSFNEPTDITLPAGAENATRMGSGTGGGGNGDGSGTAGSQSPSKVLAAPP